MQQHDFAVPPNGDVSQGWALLAVCWSFVAIAFFTTSLRVWVRTKLTRNLGWDDYIMIAAMITTIIGAVLVSCGVIVGGLGRHEYYLQADQRRDFVALGWADWIQTFITLGLTKISICLFLMRIVDARKLKLALWGLIAFLTLFTSIFVFLMLGICRPLKAYWNITSTIPGAHCLSDQQFENIIIAQGVLSIITDLICAAFPIIFLRGLQVPMRTKVLLCLLMGLGVITAACCTVRTALSGAVKDPDLSWAISSNTGWRLPEVNIGIVCANAPMLRPLWLFWSGKLDSTGRGGASGRYPSRSGGVSGGDRFVMQSNTKAQSKTRWADRDGYGHGLESKTLQGSDDGGSGLGKKLSIGKDDSGNWDHMGSLDEEMGLPKNTGGAPPKVYQSGGGPRQHARTEAWE